MKINSFIHRDGTLTLKERKKNTSISQYLYKTEFLFLRYSCHPRLGGCSRRGHDDTDCSPTQVGCYSTHGGWGGGGEIDIPVIPDLEYVQEGDMVTHIAAPPRWDVTLPMGGGVCRNFQRVALH